jgi:hypothetical protein
MLILAEQNVRADSFVLLSYYCKTATGAARDNGSQAATGPSSQTREKDPPGMAQNERNNVGQLLSLLHALCTQSALVATSSITMYASSIKPRQKNKNARPSSPSLRSIHGYSLLAQITVWFKREQARVLCRPDIMESLPALHCTAPSPHRTSN